MNSDWMSECTLGEQRTEPNDSSEWWSVDEDGDPLLLRREDDGTWQEYFDPDAPKDGAERRRTGDYSPRWRVVRWAGEKYAPPADCNCHLAAPCCRCLEAMDGFEL